MREGEGGRREYHALPLISPLSPQIIPPFLIIFLRTIFIIIKISYPFDVETLKRPASPFSYPLTLLTNFFILFLSTTTDFFSLAQLQHQQKIIVRRL